MTTFWIAAAALTAVSLAIVLPALLGRTQDRARTVRELNVAVYRDRLAELRAGLDVGDLDAEEYEQAKHDLDLALLEDVPDDVDREEGPRATAGRGRWLAVVVGLALPLAGVVLYQALGTPEAIVGRPRAVAPPGGATPGVADGQQMLPPVEEMVGNLEARLAAAPDDAEGWLTLGRSYMILRRYAGAAQAYGRAQALVGDVPDVLVDYAEALALSSENRLSGRAGEIAARALALAPDHPKALWLNGFAARQRGDPEGAVALWTRLVELLPADSEQRQVVVGLIAQAGAAGPGSGAPAGEPADPQAGAGITVNVTLDPSLAAHAAPTDTLYVFARAVDGPPMPVAIKRMTVAELPAAVVLDDSLSMVPTAKLSAYSQVVIGARVSKSGNPLPGSGDLQGVSGVVEVNVDAAVVDVRIDQRLP